MKGTHDPNQAAFDGLNDVILKQNKIIERLTAELKLANDTYALNRRVAKLEAVLREIASPTDGFGYSEDLRKIATAALQQDHDCEDHVCGPCIRCGAPQCCPICCRRDAIAALQEVSDDCRHGEPDNGIECYTCQAAALQEVSDE